MIFLKVTNIFKPDQWPNDFLFWKVLVLELTNFVNLMVLGQTIHSFRSNEKILRSKIFSFSSDFPLVWKCCARKKVYQITTVYFNVFILLFLYTFDYKYKMEQGTFCWHDVKRIFDIISIKVISIFLSAINMKVIASYLFKSFKVFILQTT